MTEIKMTKNAMRDQESLLKQLQTYLPTLQLKKSLLQAQVVQTKNRILKLREDLKKTKDNILDFCELFTSKYGMDPFVYTRIESVQKSYENIAGVEIPIFERVFFNRDDYDLYDTPIWFDSAIEKLKQMIMEEEKINVEEEKKRSLANELKEVSIRVNLFEKILIPRTIKNIKKIKIFLSDQELAAISQAKIAKVKLKKA